MAKSGKSSSTTVMTRSRLRMLWLVVFKRYSIQMAAREPHCAEFGRITYTSRWTLEKRRTRPASVVNLRSDR